MRTVFEHVAVASDAETLGREVGSGGNVVAIASDEPLDLEALRSGVAAQGLEWEVVEGAELDAWIGDSPVLTDDFAPVDQLLTPYPSARRPVA